MESVNNEMSPPEALGMTTKYETLSKRQQEINQHMMKVDRMVSLSGKPMDYAARLSMTIDLLLTQIIDLQERVKQLEEPKVIIPTGGAL